MGQEHRVIGGGNGRTIDSRVSSLETAVSVLTDDVRAIATSMEANAGETRRAIENLASKFSDGRQTNWGTMIAAGGLIVVVMGAVGAAWIRPIDVSNAWRDREERRHAEELGEVTEDVVDLRVRMAVMEALAGRP